MRNKKSQSHVEFILAAFLFLTLIIFLFTALFVRTQPEAIKIGEQTACQNAKTILNQLTAYPGKPINWDNSATGPTSVGLTNGTSGIIDYNKWQRMEALKYNRIRSSMLPNASWYANYQVYAFPDQEDPTCPDAVDTGQICRHHTGDPNLFYISAKSDNPDSIFRLRIFFPEKHGIAEAGAPPANYDANDIITTSTDDNGTLVEIHFHVGTGADAQDSVCLDFGGSGGLPDMYYISLIEYESLGGELPVLVGNTTLKDNFGAGVPSTGVSGPSGVVPAENYCNAKKRVDMLTAQNPVGLERFPIDFEVVAW